MNSDYSAPRHTDLGEAASQDGAAVGARQQAGKDKTLPLLSSEIPNSDLSVDIDSILASEAVVQDEKIQKRMSNLLKLNEENEKLQRELQAMTARLEAAERKRAQLLDKTQLDSEPDEGL